MRTLYILQQGCYLSLKHEHVIIEKGEEILQEVQLPLLEQILIFGNSLVTTPLIRTCLQRDIQVAYLSQAGHCFGRVVPVERGYRHLARYQLRKSARARFDVAKQIVWAKLKNSRVLLQRQRRRLGLDKLEDVLESLNKLASQTLSANSIEQLLGFEGAGSASYFSILDDCISNSKFSFKGRTKRPPKDPVNALLSFGYQLLWNHVLALIELQGLDPYEACLHRGNERHAALASDLIEEFRAPIIDSLALYLVNRSVVDFDLDFEDNNGGCYLNEAGRKKFLKAFLKRMEEQVHSDACGKEPRWSYLTRQVKRYKTWVYGHTDDYQPYLIR